MDFSFSATRTLIMILCMFDWRNRVIWRDSKYVAPKWKCSKASHFSFFIFFQIYILNIHQRCFMVLWLLYYCFNCFYYFKFYFSKMSYFLLNINRDSKNIYIYIIVFHFLSFWFHLYLNMFSSSFSFSSHHEDSHFNRRRNIVQKITEPRHVYFVN